MWAAVHREVPGVAGISFERVPVPPVGAHDVLVRLQWAGLNRHDLFVLDARPAGAPPLVVGSDGIGDVVQTGAAVPPMIGRRVIVNPCLGWDRTADVPVVPEILGDPRWGTLAEYVVVPAANVAPVPGHLTDPQAATLALAGLTAFRALFTVGQLAAGDHLLIPGVGGGVALLALALGRAAGATVTVTSRRPEVLDRARKLGADAAIPTNSDWARQLAGTVDVVLDTVGSAVFAPAIGTLRPGGRLVSVGATTGADVGLDLRDLFFRQVSIRGTSMASAPEFAAMLDFAARHRIRPVVGQQWPLRQAADAMAAMAANTTVGKTAISIAQALQEDS